MSSKKQEVTFDYSFIDESCEGTEEMWEELRKRLGKTKEVK